VFVGERVTLRGVRRDDIPSIWAWNNDLAVELAGGGDPPMPQAIARLYADFEREWAQGGRDPHSFAIEVDGKLIGLVGIRNFNHTARTAEFGIVIGEKEYWGQGYGREATRLILDYAFRYHNLRRVWLWTHAKNERGIRAYRAAGFVEEGRLRQHVYSDGEYDDAVYMGVLREDWDRKDTSGGIHHNI
jgi:RimJ/RimL family protein N-acetyltransferase